MLTSSSLLSCLSLLVTAASCASLLPLGLRFREGLPSDLWMTMELNKQTPFPMHVPCLDGVGSCEYDLCAMIADMGDTICASFPEGQQCGCPLLQGEMHLQGVELPVQDMGPVLGAVMEGSYSATITMFPASNKQHILSCVEFTFKLALC